MYNRGLRKLVKYVDTLEDPGCSPTPTPKKSVGSTAGRKRKKSTLESDDAMIEVQVKGEDQDEVGAGARSEAEE